jgi:hypothetical protein
VSCLCSELWGSAKSERYNGEFKAGHGNTMGRVAITRKLQPTCMLAVVGLSGRGVRGGGGAVLEKPRKGHAFGASSVLIEDGAEGVTADLVQVDV